MKNSIDSDDYRDGFTHGAADKSSSLGSAELSTENHTADYIYGYAEGFNFDENSKLFEPLVNVARIMIDLDGDPSYLIAPKGTIPMLMIESYLKKVINRDYIIFRPIEYANSIAYFNLKWFNSGDIIVSPVEVQLRQANGRKFKS